MKRRLIVVAVIGLGFLFFQKKKTMDNSVNNQKDSENISQNMAHSVNKPKNKLNHQKKISFKRGISSPTEISSKDKIKKIIREHSDQLRQFPQKQVPVWGNKYALVDGIYARTQKLKDKEPLMKMAGHYLYDSFHEDSFQVLYSLAEDKFGIFTGEVILKGGYQKIRGWVEQNGFTIIYDKPDLQMIIFQVQDVESLVTLEQQNHFQVIPDVKFGRKRGI